MAVPDRSQRGPIINLAPTGMIPTRSQSAHVPLSHAEIVDDFAACLEVGVQIVHLHARGEDGAHCSDPEPYGKLVEAIRKRPGGREVMIVVTTSGRADPEFEARSRVLELDGDMKPDMASLTLSSLNFVGSASVNEPATIRALAATMREKGIAPELEVFDLGMINFAKVLSKEGLLPERPYANVLFGNIAGAQAALQEAGTILSKIPQDWIVVFAGIGRSQLAANVLGILYADGIRVGLEDNLWYDGKRTRLARNPDLVRRAIELGTQMERPVASREETRLWLRQKGGRV